MMTKVLVVEDEALIAGDIQRTLIRLGYDVPTTAGTGERALRATSELNPCIVLMDIKLRGDMDGIDAAQAIRARFDIPIVFLTSHSDETTLSRAKATNPHGYLLKPFSDRELRTAIEVALHRHELESRIMQRERWFSTTLRSIGDAVIATDEHETITFLNAVAEKLTGWGPEAVGRPISEVFTVVDRHGAPVRSPIGVALERSFAVELPANCDLVVKGGSQIAIDDSASPIVDDKGNVLGGVVVFRDITARRKLEARVAQTERLASLGTVAAGVAHEINNPLTYVMVNIELSAEGLERAISTLGRPPEDDDLGARHALVQQLKELHDALREAGDGADRVSRIVSDLRTFGGTSEVRVTQLAITDVLASAIRMTAHAVKHHARVRLEAGPVPNIEANAAIVGQVFTNLLINAAQAIGDGHANEHEIVITTSTDPAGHAVVDVRDTGPGIPAAVLPRIFDPFFTTKPVGSGMGMGLAICHSIVSELGGTIVAANAPGGGAHFRVTLPPTSAGSAGRAGQVSPLATATTGSARRAKVLIIDDDHGVAMSLVRSLRGAHDVSVELDGRAALAKISRGAFDVILCDLMMPNMSGADVYEAIRAIDAEQAGRVVFMTGGAFSARAQALLAETKNRYLAKPFTVDAVRRLVDDSVK